MEENNREIVEILLSHNVNVNKQNLHGDTALHLGGYLKTSISKNMTVLFLKRVMEYTMRNFRK